MALWLSRSFPRIEDLVAFVNVQELASEQFKIVSGVEPRGAQVFFLIYTDEAPPHRGGARMLTAEVMPAAARTSPSETGSAVEQAEQIIHDHEVEESSS
ncbi:MAG TPA: hypothetical protein VGR16_14420 [Thermomicrobiales bacterium]|nr:hypothetical protein [Thermomicrobiales bacterium]